MIGIGLLAAAIATPTLVGYDVGARPRAVAVADLNGDGRPDVVVADAGDGTATILLGAGGGRLGPAAGGPIGAGSEPSDVEAADFDRDGDIDLVFANHETSRVTLLLNDGQARYSPAPGSPFDTGARPHVHGMATGDFDGDGWPDVAVDSADTREVRVLRGGPRGFGAVVAIATRTMPYFRLGAADVTGDRRPEILVPGQTDSTVRAIEQRGGRLVLAAWTLQLSEKPWMVVADDVSGDGRPDVIVVQSDGASVWLAGPTRFSPALGSPFPVKGATEVATGDVDGDGVADIAVGPWDGDEVTLIAGRPPTARKIRVCERPIGLAIGDLDGDHRGELLVTCATGHRLMVATFSRTP
jgi:hypothetical protein